MATPKSIIPVLMLFLSVTACTFTMTYTDRQIDKEAAEQVTTRFFLSLERKDYKGVDTLVSKKFYSVTPKQKLHEIYTKTDNELGDIQNTDLTEWHTRVVTGTDPSAEYVFYYTVKYKYYDGKVELTLQKDPDGKIRIVGYHISSDGFDDKDEKK